MMNREGCEDQKWTPIMMNDKVDRSREMETLIAEGLAKIKSTGGSRLAK
jgi:hypothetical protein